MHDSQKDKQGKPKTDRRSVFHQHADRMTKAGMNEQRNHVTTPPDLVGKRHITFVRCSTPNTETSDVKSMKPVEIDPIMAEIIREIFQSSRRHQPDQNKNINKKGGT
jgi:hypothetical protein